MDKTILELMFVLIVLSTIIVFMMVETENNVVILEDHLTQMMDKLQKTSIVGAMITIVAV